MNFEQIITAPSIHPICANLTKQCQLSIPCCTPYICQRRTRSNGTCVKCFGLGVHCHFDNQCCSNLCYDHRCTIVPPYI
ncbi:unnamed protein product [Schistosoma turkestanicum]|nr:unnamed protein product [Schistosoma turkestanicum]